MSLSFVTDSDFDTKVKKSKIPVIVEFWAEWSIDNKPMEVPLIKIRGELLNQITVLRLDIDTSPVIPKNENIREVPNLLLYNNGRRIAQLKGLRTEAEIKKWLKDKIDI